MVAKARLAIYGLPWALAAALWPGVARALDPATELTELRQDVWGIAEGLPESSVCAILQTADGYLWLGTYEGLARFDGIRFEVFDRARVPALGSNVVFALAEDHEHGLWIGTDGGGVSRLAAGRFTTLDTREGLADNRVSSLAVDGDGAVWIGTAAGLNRWAGDELTTYTTADGLPGDVVVALEVDDAGDLWIATETGLGRRHDGRFSAYTTRDGLADDWVIGLGRGRGGRFWIATAGGLSVWADGGLERVDLPELAGEHVDALLADRDGALWLGVYGRGVARLHRGELSFFGPLQGLPSDAVWSLYEDREGSLWIGTVDGGLARLVEASFRTLDSVDGLPHERVATVLEDRQGEIWIGTDGGGLVRLAGDELAVYTTADGLPSDNLSALHEGLDGTLWAGAYDGLSRRDGSRFTTVSLGLVPGVSVLALHQDRHGSLWIGTDSAGLLRLDPDGVRENFTRMTGLPDLVVRALAEDRRGRLWVGVDGGLARLENGVFLRQRTAALAGAMVRTLHVDGEDTLWIGTRDRGLVRYRDGVATSFSSRDGLPGDTVYQLLEDREERLWMSSNTGIFRIAKDRLEIFAEDRSQPLESRIFGVADGMPSPAFMGGSQPAGWRTRDGRLLFANVRGLVTVDPRTLTSNPLPPPVLIEHLLVDRRKVDLESGGGHEGELRLPPGRGEIEIHFTGLSLRDPHGQRFRYRLDGYDQHWVEAGDRRTAFYTNLHPGNYTFQVIAANADGVWNESGVRLAFTLRPRFYQTWTFYVLLGIFLLLAGWTVHGLRTRRLLQRTELLESMVAARTAEVVSQRDELARTSVQLAAAMAVSERANQTKSRFLARVSDAMRMPLAGVLDRIDALRGGALGGEQRRLAEEVAHGGERLRAIVDDVRDFSALEGGELLLGQRPFSPRECVDRCLAAVADVAAARGAALRREVAGSVPRKLSGDGARLRQALLNLLVRALELVDRGEVVLTVAARPARVRVGRDAAGADGIWEVHFAVHGSTIGLAPERLERLFDAFQQEREGAAGEHAGSGLELALVRHLAEVMGGTVWAESAGDRGATFHLTIVAPEADPETAGAAAATRPARITS